MTGLLIHPGQLGDTPEADDALQDGEEQFLLSLIVLMKHRGILR